VIYHVHQGRGRTHIGEAILEWQQGDTFCVPAWQPYRHEAAKNAYLFRYADRQVLTATGAYRSAASASGPRSKPFRIPRPTFERGGTLAVGRRTAGDDRCFVKAVV